MRLLASRALITPKPAEPSTKLEALSLVSPELSFLKPEFYCKIKHRCRKTFTETRCSSNSRRRTRAWPVAIRA